MPAAFDGRERRGGPLDQAGSLRALGRRSAGDGNAGGGDGPRRRPRNRSDPPRAWRPRPVRAGACRRPMPLPSRRPWEKPWRSVVPAPGTRWRGGRGPMSPTCSRSRSCSAAPSRSTEPSSAAGGGSRLLRCHGRPTSRHDAARSSSLRGSRVGCPGSPSRSRSVRGREMASLAFGVSRDLLRPVPRRPGRGPNGKPCGGPACGSRDPDRS